VKKRIRKPFVLVIAALLFLVPALAACSNDGGSGNNPSGSNNQSQAEGKSAESGNAGKDAESDKPAWDYKYEPAITISTAIVDENRPNAFKPGESLHDNAHSRWMEENLGIKVKYDWTVGKFEDYDTKLRLALSTNTDLPDTFNTGGDILQNLIAAKKLLPLDDAINEYASPALKEVLEKYPYTLSEATSDGKIYGLPRFFMGDEGTVMWIRKDWLDKLSLQPPATIAELETVLKAFSEQDPNENGKDDEYGMAVPLKEGPWTWMGQTDAIAGAFTKVVLNTYDVKLFWTEDENGKLMYGALHPDAKKYLETMRDWMSKGYIDKEAGIKDPSKAAELAVSGQAGVMFGPFWMGAWPLADTLKIDPNAEWVAYGLPAGPDGLKGRGQKPLLSGYQVFSKDFEHIEAWFKYYNKLLAQQIGPDDPNYDPRFEKGFHEGYDYVMHEGKAVVGNFEAAGVPKEKWPLADGSAIDTRWMIYSLHGTNKPTIPYMNSDAVKKFIADPNAEALTPIEQSVQGFNATQLQGASVAIAEQDMEIPNLFNGALTPGMEKNGEFLKKLATESYLKIIYGEKPLEYFDEFVVEYLKNGGQQITDEVNEWYEQNK